MSWGQSLEAFVDKELHQNTPNTPQPEKISFLASMVRFTWRILGNILLFIILLLMVFGYQGESNALDIIFWLVVAGLVLIRYIDIKVFHEQSADNKPITLKDWIRYSIGLILMSGFFWVLARAIFMRIH